MDSVFCLKHRGSLEYFEIEFPCPGIARGIFTTRKGGVSLPPFNSLNMAFHVGDEKEKVLLNRKIAADALGIPLEEFTSGEQVHGDKVVLVEEEQRGRGAFDLKDVIPGADALITGKKNVALTAFFADCVPIYILCPHDRKIGIAHAGWKGTALGIAGKTVKAMKAAFGVKERDCMAFIGPSIGPCCYTVGENVYMQFSDHFENKRDDFFKKLSHEKWSLDLWTANKYDLIFSGIEPKNIFVSGLCTCCNENLFFSYRRENGKTGRMAAVFKLI
ncbi:MAG TPA: peptidoglycan editing factor PgeF [Peptococcaceae bacterium]|nr:MAG: Multi-copper polyphenol oxidoreductase, laccase [Clostridia bacterium 41_269]HBT20096.1 peptidoglycan editing factor PgeF [Peptococcaceae bacterium]